MYKLVISDDEGKTTTVPLVRDEITIGRKEGNTIRLTDRNVSRRHAKLQKQNGGYVLQDLGSYNGTVINGTRLSDQRALKMGDQIVIGDYKLNIVEENAAQVAPAPAAPAPNANVVERFEAPAQSGGHHPQATMPAIPTALGVPPPPTTPVPDALARQQLIFLAPAGTPSPYTIKKVPVLLGRSEIADISLPFSSISREHAKITIENDQFVIEDLGSSNGVVINGERVQKHPIKVGDAITMGVVECKLARIGEATALLPAPTAAIAATEPEAAAPAKKSSAGVLVAVGVLVAALGGGGAMIAMKGSTPTTQPSANSTVVSGSEPATNAAPAPQNAAQPPTQPTANTQEPAQNAQPTTNTQEPAQNAQPAQPENNGGAEPAQPAQAAQPSSAGGSEPTAAGAPTPRVRTRSSSNSAESNATATGAAPTTTTTTQTTTRSNPSATTAPSGGNTGSSAAAGASNVNVGQCLLNNDFQCVVGALRNRASTETELNQLVTAYKGLHNQAAAEQTMRRYLSRFPDGRYAERYRDTLGQ